MTVPFLHICPSINGKSILSYISANNADILMKVLSIPMFSRARKTISPFMKCCLLIMHHFYANLFRHWWKIYFVLYLRRKCNYFDESAVYTHIFKGKEDNKPIYEVLLTNNAPFLMQICSAIGEKSNFLYISERNANILMNMLSTPIFSGSKKRMSPFI